MVCTWAEGRIGKKAGDSAQMQRSWEDRVEKRRDLGGPGSPDRGGQGREAEMKARNGKEGQKVQREARMESWCRVAGEEGSE